MANDYEILTATPISPARIAVLSIHKASGGYTLAQRLDADDGTGKAVQLFMKGALHIDSIDSLVKLRDALSEAIEKARDTK